MPIIKLLFQHSRIPQPCLVTARTETGGFGANSPGGDHRSAGGGDSGHDRTFPAACLCARLGGASTHSVSLTLQNHGPRFSCRGPPDHGVRPTPGLLTVVQPAPPWAWSHCPPGQAASQPPSRPSCCRGEDTGQREPGEMKRRGECPWGPR